MFTPEEEEEEEEKFNHKYEIIGKQTGGEGRRGYCQLFMKIVILTLS